MKPQTATQDSARSPFAGCAIMITALLVMVFLIGFSFVTLFRQFNEIAKFTGETPAPVEVSSLEGREAELNQFAERLESFRQQLSGESEAKLSLSPDEINFAIAAYAPFKDLRGTFRVIGAEKGVLRIAISFPLNGKPRLAKEGEEGWVHSDARYLNATLLARPALLKRELVLLLDEIQVPGGVSVPREFIEQMSPYRITERYLADPVLGPAMGKLTRVEVADGRLTLGRVPGEEPADVIGRDQVNNASQRFFVILGVAACLFLTFAGLVVILGLRAKARKQADV
jgi:hypothetical protein